MSGPEVRQLPSPEVAIECLTQKYNRTLPEARGEIDRTTGNHLVFAMQQVWRAAVYEHESDETPRYQNNAEHSFAVTKLGLLIATQDKRKDLDLAIIAIDGIFHDTKEVFGGDTPIFDEELLLTKKERELMSDALVHSELAQNIEIAVPLEDFETKDGPNEIYMHAVDGLEAALFALSTKCVTQRNRQDDPEKFLDKQFNKAFRDPSVYWRMEITLRQIMLKWNGWGCRAIEGDPDELVDRYVKKYDDLLLKASISSAESEADYSEQLETDDSHAITAYIGGLTTEQLEASPENVVSLDDARNLRGPDNVDSASRKIPSGHVAKVLSLSSRRRFDAPDPLPPTA